MYFVDKRRHRGDRVDLDTVRLEDDKYALHAIGKESVYKYFVSDSVLGWLLALICIGTQIWILAAFIEASEINLQNDRIDIQFVWKCFRDNDVCQDMGDLDRTGWAMFGVLMAAFLLRDFIMWAKLIAHSAKRRHSFISRLRYFVGGLCVGWVAVFTLYVSTKTGDLVHAIISCTSDNLLILLLSSATHIRDTGYYHIQ